MLERTSKLVHKATGVTVETPLLVPSFSSKGFSGIGFNSDVAKLADLASELIEDVCLISAFDLARGNLPEADDLLLCPRLIIVDSGGYESSGDYDLSEVMRQYVGNASWSVGELKRVLRAWPDERPAVFVSYDNQTEAKSLDDQLAESQTLFDQYARNHLRCFLVKPEPSDADLGGVIQKISEVAEALKKYDIIGFTEKELGNSAWSRMVRIATIRQKLDTCGVSTPLHIFGSLDPLSVCLYAISGAEIFDGLTWLRFVYSEDGQCIYRNSYTTLTMGLDFDVNNHELLMKNNFYYLQDLQEKLRNFSQTGDLSRLPEPEFLSRAQSRLREFLKVPGEKLAS